MQTRIFPTFGLLFLVLLLIITAGPLKVDAQGGPPDQPLDPPTTSENPSNQYDSILYAEIGPHLAEIAANSKRVRVEVLGQSAGGRDLYLVTLSDPQTMGRLGRYQAIRRLMLTDPEAAQELLDSWEDFKVPVFINASIHGTEYYGVDAAIRLIETLAEEDSPEIQSILESVILLVNIVANPDGRVGDTRERQRVRPEPGPDHPIPTRNPGHHPPGLNLESNGHAGPTRVGQPDADRALHTPAQSQL